VQTCPIQQLHVVEVHDRTSSDAVGGADGHLGGNASNRRGDRPDDHRVKVATERIACEDDDGAALVEIGEPYLTSTRRRKAHSPAGP
jgi:hypothetical protein